MPLTIDGAAVGAAAAAELERKADEERAQFETTPDDPAAGSTDDAYEQGWKAGYAAALETKRLPLFEACKQAVVAGYQSSVEILDQVIDQIEADYDERLTRADRQLILGEALRLQRAARARAEGDRPVTRLPKPAGRREADLPGPAATEYEHVT